MGFIYDLERHNDSCWHDRDLYNRFKASIAGGINQIKAFNNSYSIYNTAGIWMMYTSLPLGGGDEVEMYRQHLLMSLSEYWDGYQWQLYRGNAVDPASDPDSTNIYERMLSSVQYLGPKKTIPLFGMTGVGDYGPNNCSNTSPGTAQCNFQGVVRDCRLARALGIKEVSFFTLCDAGVYNGVYYPSMFEAYGQDFLDKLDASVNDRRSGITGNKSPTTFHYWLVP
jgi:hypothetical protein